MSRQLILENRQAPGDALMLSCAVRDLHLKYPHEFKTAVVSPHADIWLHNPYCNDANRDLAATHIKLGYSKSINASNKRCAHFATGFVQELSEKLGTRIALTDIRPSVLLSDDERAPISRPLPYPYWIVVAGGKSDMPAKMWDPAYMQRVVDVLRAEDGLKFAQVGRATHLHTPLRGVANLLGKTTFRQLMIAVYHAQGVICPVTCAMHLAAAFNRPCVVTAGGREPWWWEAYTKATWAVNVPGTPCPPDFVEHSFLHTMGLLPCCNAVGCGRSKISEPQRLAVNCKRVVKGQSVRLPACLDMITPEMVIDAVRRYVAGKPVITDPIPTRLKPPLFVEKLEISAAVKPGIVPTAPRAAAQPHRNKGKVNKRYFLRTVSRHSRVLKPAPRPLIVAPRGIKRTPVYRKLASVPRGSLPPAETRLRALGNTVTICVLAYGDYPGLLQKCLESIYNNTNVSQFELRLGLNAVSERVLKYVQRFVAGRDDIRLYTETRNIYKYPMMRRMFTEHPLTTKWVVWLDDDSRITAPDWLPRLDAYAASRPCDMVGKQYYHHVSQGMMNWIRAASWFKARDLVLRHGRLISEFATGGWWALKTEVIKRLDWPDRRLSHRGDVELGSALFQIGAVLRSYAYGVVISGYPRRGASQQRPTA